MHLFNLAYNVDDLEFKMNIDVKQIQRIFPSEM